MKIRTSLLIPLLLGMLAAPLAARAQQAAKVLRVGFLYPGPTAAATPRLAAFLEGLRGMGYVQGQHFTLESRVAEGRTERLPTLAAELVNLRVDVVLAMAAVAVQAARGATTTIPIIALDLETDPLATKLIASLARPGGNITGIFLDFPDFSGKWLEFLKEVVPTLSRVAIFWDPDSGAVQLKAAEAAARSLRLEVQIMEVRNAAGFEEAFRSARQAGAGAVLMLGSPVFGGSLKLAADLAVQNRLPAITLFREFPQAGGLLAYGPNINELSRQGGVLAGRVLKGTKPAELPAERPTRFELLVNLKTAKALGLSIPKSLRLRADQVIE